MQSENKLAISVLRESARASGGQIDRRFGCPLLAQSGHDRIPESIPGVGLIGTNFRPERFGVYWGCVHSQIKSGIALWQIRTNLASYSPTDFGPMAHASRS